MKFKFFMLSVLMVLTVYGQVLADSCSSSKDASCPDGVCSVTESHQDHDHSAHGHDKSHNKVEKPSDSEPHHPHKAATLNTLALKTLMDSGVPVIILDARSGKWDDGSRIPGAKSLNAESKPEEIAKVIPSKDSLVITYCSNLKCPASDMLYKHLKSLGYSNVIEYPEGIQGWKEAGNQVKKAF